MLFDDISTEYQHEQDELEYRRLSKLHIMFINHGFQYFIKPIDIDYQTDRIYHEHAAQ